MNKVLLPILASGLLIGGCVQFFPSPADAPGIYRLSSDVDAVPLKDGVPIVTVSSPRVPQALAGRSISLSPDGQRIVYAAGARWQEPVAPLLQSSLLDTLSGNPDIGATRPGSNIRGDYALDIDLSAFEAEFDQGRKNAPLAKLRMKVTLTDLSTRKLIKIRNFSADQRAASNKIGDVVSAMDDIVRETNLEIGSWLKESLPADQAGL